MCIVTFRNTKLQHSFCGSQKANCGTESAKEANITETFAAGRKERFDVETPLLVAELKTKAVSFY